MMNPNNFSLSSLQKDLDEVRSTSKEIKIPEANKILYELCYDVISQIQNSAMEGKSFIHFDVLDWVNSSDLLAEAIYNEYKNSGLEYEMSNLMVNYLLKYLIEKKFTAFRVDPTEIGVSKYTVAVLGWTL